MFQDSRTELNDAFSQGNREEAHLALEYAKVGAIHANTAALVMIAGLIANATGQRDADLEGWAKVIPSTPLRECWGPETRRPECTPRHTEDCRYADPVPEPKHELLPVGTRVLVQPMVLKYPDGRTEYPGHPYAAKIDGYNLGRTKYRIRKEFGDGKYHSYTEWVFADNRVQVHPDGPECLSPPQPVKREPTGPRVYVKHPRGKDGYVVEFGRKGEDRVAALVQWHTPGTVPVWVSMDRLTVIHPDDVARCPNGRTGDECGSGENQCELCLQAEDEEGDMIERSMGLR
jgi:hypothetical protein